jgi:hypothetical protein
MYIQYWWYFRFNRSPIQNDLICLPGLSLQEISCFDHEGDWEGVTVTVRRIDGKYRGKRVMYTGHGWPYGYSYDWATLDRVDSLDSLADTHPDVFVAYGSHASYPVKCVDDDSLLPSCTQLDFRLHTSAWIGWALLGIAVASALVALMLWSRYWLAAVLFAVLGVAALVVELPVPDGDHSGSKHWRGNFDGRCRAHDCLVELPHLPSGQPFVWNAFPGEWGKSECTTFKYFCVRAAGPIGPATKCARDPKCRYRRPELDTPGSEQELTGSS